MSIQFPQRSLNLLSDEFTCRFQDRQWIRTGAPTLDGIGRNQIKQEERLGPVWRIYPQQGFYYKLKLK